LFLRFNGPSTILLQSRGSRLRDVLTSHDVNEIADAPAGAVQSAASSGIKALPAPSSESSAAQSQAPRVPESVTMTHASVGKDGKVKFEEAS